MLLLLNPPLGAVLAMTLTLATPAPTFTKGPVTQAVAPVTMAPGVASPATSQGPPNFPAGLPLLLVRIPPGNLQAQDLHFRLPPAQALPGGRTNTLSTGQTVSLTLPVIGTKGSPGTTTPVFALNSVTITPVKFSDFEIDASNGSKPKMCSFVIVAGAGVTPAAGMDLRIGLQSFFAQNLIFGGTIQTCDQTSDDIVENQEYHVTAIGYTYLLNRRFPIKVYVNVAGDAIVRDLAGTFSAGFTTAHVQGGFASVSIAFDGTKDFSACMDQLCALIGAYWRVDDSKDLHLFATAETDQVPDALDRFPHPTALQTPPLRYEVDTSQVRTRVKAQGASGGSTSVAIAITGSMALPIGSALPFGATGGGPGGSGRAVLDVPIVGVPGGLSQRVIVSYSQAGQGSLITATPTLVSPPFGGFLGINQVTGSALLSGSYLYGVSYSTLAGETPLATTQFFLPNAPCNAQIASYPTPNVFQQQQGMYRANFYRSRVNDLSGTVGFVGSVEVGSNGFWPTFIDSVPDASLGSVPPIINSAYVSNVTSVTNANSNGGSIPVPNAYAWTAPGAILINGQAFPYTSVIGNGIGASVPYNVPAGTRVTSSAALLGVNIFALNGPGLSAFPAGVPVSSYVQIDDAAAQAAIAALEGGDGIHEYWITDGALVTPQMLTDRALAELALFKAAKVTVRYSTRDPKTGVGRAITINLPAPQALSGTFMIQSVRMSEIGQGTGLPASFPRYDVVASNTRYSLDDLLRQLGGLLNQQNLR